MYVAKWDTLDTRKQCKGSTQILELSHRISETKSVSHGQHEANKNNMDTLGMKFGSKYFMLNNIFWIDNLFCSMIQVNVTLPSGRAEHFSLEASSKVGDLRSLAKQSFNQGFLRLVTENGHVLTDPRESRPQAAGIKDGDNLTAIALEVSVMASARAFAIWCNGGGKLVTWGDPDCGGDSSAVQDQLLKIQQLQASDRAFAAVLADGSVVTWGNSEFGGDSSNVNLKNVRDIQATGGAFAAILTDGSVVTWGDPDVGGDSSQVQGNLRNVRLVQGSRAAFAAILSDGSVVSWGPPFFGGDSSEVKDELKNVQRMQGSMAFAAILGDGSVVTWGYPAFGGDSSCVQGQLTNVQEISATNSAFAALLADGSVVTWGDRDCGGDSSQVQYQLQEVQQIKASGGSFAAVLEGGSVVTWVPAIPVVTVHTSEIS